MLCRIADLYTEVPEAGGMAPRCKEYLCAESTEPHVVIHADRYSRSGYPETMTDDDVAYMESGVQFYIKLLEFGGLYLHSSAVALDGKAYLFSGPCGMGKSTHTRLWQQTFGSAAQVINDDKPALRRIDGTWYAYGTPWCGKDGINQNKKVPLGGICFLQQAPENKIRRLSEEEAATKILTQTFHKFKTIKNLDRVLQLVDQLVQEIPIYELENRPEPEAARLSYETMRPRAEGDQK